MDFDDLTHFAVLAEELNFRRATQRLDVRQPTLTRRIRRLEQELGVYLLERHARRINLTRAGEIFAERSQHLIDEGSADSGPSQNHRRSRSPGR